MAKKIDGAPVRVLIATALCEDKAYCLPFVQAAMRAATKGVPCDFLILSDGWQIPEGVEWPDPASGRGYTVLPAEGAPESLIGRIVRTRIAMRDHFLAGSYTHLYLHDADVIAPEGTVAALLDTLGNQDAEVATALYPCRGQSVPVAPVLLDGHDRAALMDRNDVFCAESQALSVVAFGMGCMLIARSAMERTPFHPPAWYTAETMQEDWQWCVDSGTRPILRTDLACWHVEEDGMASTAVVGAREFQAMWTDTPHWVNNRFGFWTKGVPRSDISMEDALTLPAGFITRHGREVRLVRKPVAEVAPK